MGFTSRRSHRRNGITVEATWRVVRLFPRVLRRCAWETKVEANKTISFGGKGGSRRTEMSRKNISNSCGSLKIRAAIFLSSAPLFYPLLATFLLAVCAWLRFVLDRTSTSDPSAIPRAVVSFVINSIFAARDFSVGFLDAVREAVTGILLRLPGFSIIRDKHDFDSIYLAILDEATSFFIRFREEERRDRKPKAVVKFSTEVPISI